MNKLRVINVNSDVIEFEDKITLRSHHDQDCCESHYLNLDDLTIEDFKGLEFDLSNDSFFRRIPDYGIELIPIQGHSVKIAGYGYNNGYYSSALTLIIQKDNKSIKEYDITDCQIVQG